MTLATPPRGWFAPATTTPVTPAPQEHWKQRNPFERYGAQAPSRLDVENGGDFWAGEVQCIGEWVKNHEKPRVSYTFLGLVWFSDIVSGLWGSGFVVISVVWVVVFGFFSPAKAAPVWKEKKKSAIGGGLDSGVFTGRFWPRPSA